MRGQRLQMGCRIHSSTELSRLFQAVFQEYQLEVKEKSNLSLTVDRIYVLENIYTAACWTGWQGGRGSIQEPSSCCLQHSLASFPLIVSHKDVRIIYFWFFVSCVHNISKFLCYIRANTGTTQWEFSELFLVQSPALQHHCRIQDEMQ